MPKPATKTALKAPAKKRMAASVAKKSRAKPAGQHKPAIKTLTPAQQLEPVFELMREGESARRACKATGVAGSTLYRLLEENKDLQERYAQARARMLDAQAEMLEEIGEQAALSDNAVEVAGLRLQSDNRKWLLSKLAPKKYGDKLALGQADDLLPLVMIKDLSGRKD